MNILRKLETFPVASCLCLALRQDSQLPVLFPNEIKSFWYFVVRNGVSCCHEIPLMKVKLDVSEISSADNPQAKGY